MRILGLPVKDFKEFGVAKIGMLVGNVVKVDQLTIAQATGKLFRICVEVGISKHFKPFIEVESEASGVVYEEISMICFNSGCYGHVKDICPFMSLRKLLLI